MEGSRPKVRWLVVLACILIWASSSTGSSIPVEPEVADAFFDYGETVASSRRQLSTESNVNATVYSGGFVGGWKSWVSGGSAIQTVIEYRGNFSDGNGLCVTLQSPGAWVAFRCSNCSAYPFTLNNTAGLVYAMAEVNLDSSGKFGSPLRNGDSPNHMNVSLYDGNDEGFNSICTMDLSTYDSFQGSALYEGATLWQNFPSANGAPDCRDAFPKATAVGFMSKSENVSVCMDNIKLRPSTVELQDDPQALSDAPEYQSPWQNCWQTQPLPMTTKGNYTGHDLPPYMTQNFTRDTSARSIIAWPRIDVPYRHYLSQVNGTCSVINSTYLSDINDCVKTSPWAYGGKVGAAGSSSGLHGLACCYNTSNTSEDEVLELLLDMCDNLLLGRDYPDNPNSDPHGQRCYGIEYIRSEKRAYFLSQSSGEHVLTPLTGGGDQEICNNPEAVMYFARGATPEWVPVAGQLDHSNIYSSSLQMGWKLDTWSSNLTVGSMNYTDANNTAMCFIMPTSKDTPRFICQDCPSNATHGIDSPFWFNTTSGFQMLLSQAEFDSSSGFVTNSSGVAPKLSLLSNAGKELCSATPYQTTSTPTANNFTEATFLFQNNRDCIDKLDQVAGLKFSPPDGTEGVWSFCIDKLGLLPSQVNDTLPQIGVLGTGNVTDPIPPPNCDLPDSSAVEGQTPYWLVHPQPINEGGNFTVSGLNLNMPSMANAQPNDGFTFSLRQNWDLKAGEQGEKLKMSSANSTIGCSQLKSFDIDKVDQCAARYDVCCFTSDENDPANQKRQQNVSRLAQICNQLQQPLKLCLGWVYDYNTGIATFLGQLNSTKLDGLVLDGAICSRPNATMYLLQSAVEGLLEKRTFSSGSDPVSPSTDSGWDVGATVGVVLGVLGPTAVIVGWLVVTYRYRLSKRKLVAEVVKRLKVDDIADSSAVALDPAPRPPRIVVSATRQLAAAGLLRATSATPLKLSSAPSAASQGITEPTPEMKQAVGKMVRLCLRQWDGPLGLYAGSDPFGGRNGVGVWRGKFENVRCAALVMAMHRANKAKMSNSTSAATLMQAWQQSKTSKERQKVAEDIAKMLQNITGAEAQSLPNKDPETIDSSEGICSRCMFCC